MSAILVALIALVVFAYADIRAFDRILDYRSELTIGEFMQWLGSDDHRTAMRFGGAFYLQYIAKRGAP